MSAPRRPPRRPVDGVLLLDKPLGMTSNAALQQARRLFNAAKAGHTGTLDPLATGLLPLCLGEATKFAGELLDADKAYDATIRLGVTTETADAEGAVIEVRPVNVTDAAIATVLASFVGDILQVPPMYSALKRDGKALYEYARQGIEIERKARRITIQSICLLGREGDMLSIAVDCSKGTYIRTLAEDIGKALGCGAHLAGLRRTRIGRHTLDGAVTLEQIESGNLIERDRLLAPVDTLLASLPCALLSESEAQQLNHGQPLRWQGKENAAAGRYRAYRADVFLGLCELSVDGWLKPVRLVAVPQVFCVSPKV